nr:MAG TPA: hypothetical protein [Bacteriophage sp.]
MRRLIKNHCSAISRQKIDRISFYRCSKGVNLSLKWVPSGR